MARTVLSRIFVALEFDRSSGPAGKILGLAVAVLIALNVAAVIIETVDDLAIQYSRIFSVLEIVSVIIFTVEYALRVISCISDERYRHPVGGRLKYALTPMVLIDLIAILPFYLPLLIPLDLRFVRVLRLLRVLRMFKLGRYSNSLRILGSVFRAKKEELMICAFTVMILLILSSCLVYFIENEVQPDRFSSIPATMWWGVATLTTVGYGDIYPVTAMGKFLGAIIAFLGIGLFALPAGILASGFAEAIGLKHDRSCPYCGKNIEEAS